MHEHVVRQISESDKIWLWPTFLWEHLLYKVPNVQAKDPTKLLEFEFKLFVYIFFFVVEVAASNII